MLKHNDLRIGNWIETKHGVQQVTQVEESRVLTRLPPCTFSMINFHYEEVNPILLSEEWLTRLGFERDNRRYSPTKFLYQKYPITFYGGDKYIKLNGNYEYNILYVHQLQNLFHVLTGEELTI